MVGYRTIVFNLLMGLLGAARAVWPDMVLPDDTEITRIFDSLWAIITVTGNLGLRFATKGPVGVKEPECK